MYCRVYFMVLASVVISITAVAQVDRGNGPLIQGRVQSGQSTLPGASVVAINAATFDIAMGVTNPVGEYTLLLPAPGQYTVTAQMTAFAVEGTEVTVVDGSPVLLNFDLTLLSRVQPNNAAASRSAMVEALLQQRSVDSRSQETSPDEFALLTDPAPGMSLDAATESVAISGTAPSPAFGGMFDPEQIAQRLQEIEALGPGARGGPEGPGALAGLTGQRGAGAGARGGALGGPAGGGPGGAGGRGGPVVGGARGFGAVNRPSVNLGYTLGDSSLDAAPYSLTGQPADKPSYTQNSFSAAVSGPLLIPKIYNGGANNFFSVTYNGSRNRSPFDAFSTVPTLAERSGDFSQTLSSRQPVSIINPSNGLPFAENRIPSSLVDPAAAGLLQYIPEPNQPGNARNFHFVTTNKNSGDDINVRFNHSFGAGGQRGGRGGGPGGGFPVGGPRGGGGRGGGGGMLSIGLQHRSQENTSNRPLPSVSGETSTKGIAIPVSFSRSLGRLNASINVNFNRNRTSSTNLYSSREDIAGSLGILGVSTDPFDWGIPSLSFRNFADLNDIQPSQRVNQTFQAATAFTSPGARQTFRWGGDFRIIHLDSRSSSNSRGTFTFTGFYSGFDLADFLLGLPQLTSVQYGSGSYRFRGNSWSLFVQDDWRIRSNLTLNLGLRYEYNSPFTEVDDRIVNLDVSPGFDAVASVLPGSAGPFTGLFPSTLVNPDRNNFAPRVGIAWVPFFRTVMRAGYGINYNNSAYNSIVQQMSQQPPFSVTQTNIASAALPLTLQDGFPSPPPSTLTNNYAINKDYRIGYAQMWNLNVQREIPLGLVVNLDYTGTKGTRLDMVTAPNRTAEGLRIEGVQPFTWQTSDANSIVQTGSLRVSRRLQAGVSVGGTYTFSKALDNASSLGGGANVVAQDAFNLAAERGLSSSDQPHRFNGNYVMQLPFGQNKPWLSGDGLAATLFGDWQLSGTWTLASGSPSTARILGDAGEISRGTNGSLRADVTGQPITVDAPTTGAWFNAAAFALPAPGTYGSAGRNTIRGPGTRQFDMSLNKTFSMSDTQLLDVRIQSTNVFNMPQYRSIDTTVNSPSFGQVTSGGSMRKVQIVARYRF